MRTLRRLLCVLAVLAALPLHAELRGKLLEPRAGTILRGGTTATIDWSATSLPDDAEEWEAFLSVDGGRFYAYRITPHLELDERRFTFEVPNVETERARILIRAGDEHEETELEFPVSFSIRQDPLLELSTADEDVVEEERGEAARPGDRGVVRWVDGDRHGQHLATRSALRHQAALREARLANVLTEIAEAAGPLSSDAAASGTSRRIITAPAQPTRRTALHRAGRAVLLTYRRLNL